MESVEITAPYHFKDPWGKIDGWSGFRPSTSSTPGIAKGNGGPAASNTISPPATDDSETCPRTQNPVIPSTGEKYKNEYDFTAGGEYGLSMSRTYRSKQASGSLFGPNWLSNWDIPRISYTTTGCTITPEGACIPQKAVVTNPDGTKYTHKFLGLSRMNIAELSSRRAKISSLTPLGNAGTTAAGDSYDYSSGGLATGTLVYTPGSGWTLVKGHTTYFYNDGGRIQSISDDAGIGVNYTYSTTTARLYRVTHTNGKYLEFGWGTNSRVATVRDASGSIWNYGYNSAGMLTTVTSPAASGQAADVRTYHYENADVTLLTGISINGVRYSTYSYYPDKRVQQSGLAGGRRSIISSMGRIRRQ